MVQTTRSLRSNDLHRTDAIYRIRTSDSMARLRNHWKARVNHALGAHFFIFNRVPSGCFSILLILLLALALRLLLWSQPLHQLANDEVEYVAVARDLLAGRGWQFYDHYHWLRAPLYPLFLAGSLWLAGGDPSPGLQSISLGLARSLHLAALPNIALSVATIYLSYRLTLALFGRRTQAALLAALFSAVLWTFAT